jgi:hypothetical protein
MTVALSLAGPVGRALGRSVARSTGGVSPPPPLWTPTALGSALALWLDADDAATITLNGSTVSQCNDKSGNNRHAFQATAANQPTYTPSGLNGKPVITFDGVNDFLSSLGWSGLISGLSGLTVSAVIRGTFGSLINTAGNGGSQFSIESGGAFWINTTTPINIPFTANADIQNYTFDAGIRQAHRNGTLLQQTTAAPNTINTASDSIIDIGRRSWVPQFLNANVSELLLIRAALSTTDRQRLEGYLAHKWGLEANLPAGHPFKSLPPTV